MLESRNVKWVPSATAMGIAMVVPASVIFVMFLGGLVEMTWRKRSPRTYELYATPLASGLIAGEAIIAVIIPLLVVVGIMHL